ncbi:hypothetical protein AK830_g2392 [Neonectria ditissima]|uniref:Ribonuclease H1 N-terminal domain-containing protein n=1 Tax=Neonectria ditissima TaxID=78410 RepID=A0A0P7BSD3_9HYPO|nr:hypothetical protein AK830_g2392 [Neonectria ditissima]
MVKYYAVAVGKETGVFETWEQTKPLVTGSKGAKHQSFRTYEEAAEFVNTNKTDSEGETVLQPHHAPESRLGAPSAASMVFDVFH